MEKALQALQALSSHQYVMDLYQGFPEQCKTELGLCVDNELSAMIVSGRKLKDERKNKLAQKLKTVSELSEIMFDGDASSVTGDATDETGDTKRQKTLMSVEI